MGMIPTHEQLEVFSGDNAMQIVARHVSSEPLPPSRHSLFDVSPALDALVLACLQKKPADRPARGNFASGWVPASSTPDPGRCAQLVGDADGARKSGGVGDLERWIPTDW